MNSNYNYYYSKIKIDYLISENDNLNKELKKLNKKIKILKHESHINNMKMIETLNYNISMLKQDIKTIKLKNKNDEADNDEFIQIY
jgi:hypothetical protein